MQVRAALAGPKGVGLATVSGGSKAKDHEVKRVGGEKNGRVRSNHEKEQHNSRDRPHLKKTKWAALAKNN